MRIGTLKETYVADAALFDSRTQKAWLAVAAALLVLFVSLGNTPAPIPTDLVGQLPNQVLEPQGDPFHCPWHTHPYLGRCQCTHLSLQHPMLGRTFPARRLRTLPTAT